MNHKEIIHTKEFISILWDELNVSIRESINTRYADTKINDEVKKDLIRNTFLDALVYWKLQSTKEAKTIGANPTMELAKTRLDNLRKRDDATDLIISALANYIAKEFEHSMNLGHTDAFIYLCNEATIVTPPSIKLINPAPCYGFQYRGDINHFYNQCIEYKVIDSTTSLDSFKIAFEGCDYRGEKPLKWTTTQKNHIVYLFDLLLEKKLVHKHIEKDDKFIQINPDVTIGVLMGKTNNQVSKIRASWKQYGGTTPSKADYIENLIASLTK
jgi:Zn ribbon nucleic-acid-binding protein